MIARIARSSLFAAMVRAVLRCAMPGTFRALSLDHSPSLAACGRCTCHDCAAAAVAPSRCKACGAPVDAEAAFCDVPDDACWHAWLDRRFPGTSR